MTVMLKEEPELILRSTMVPDTDQDDDCISIYEACSSNPTPFNMHKWISLPVASEERPFANANDVITRILLARWLLHVPHLHSCYLVHPRSVADQQPVASRCSLTNMQWLSRFMQWLTAASAPPEVLPGDRCGALEAEVATLRESLMEATRLKEAFRDEAQVPTFQARDEVGQEIHTRRRRWRGGI
jgi:hypothetical protein